METWINRFNGQQNLYWTVNDLRAPAKTKPKKAHIDALAFLHVDVDPRKGGEAESERMRILSALESFNPPPSAIVDSGGGYQAFWRLDVPLFLGGDSNRIAEAEAYNLHLAKLLEADHCHNVDRVMRLPGTTNLPNATKLSRGRTARLATAIYLAPPDERIYSLGEFSPAETCPKSLPGKVEEAQSDEIAPQSVFDRVTPALSPRIRNVLLQGDDPDDPERYPSRSEAVWAISCALVRAGCTDHEVTAVLLEPAFGISAHVRAQKRPQDYAARQAQRAREAVEQDALQIQTDEDGKVKATQHNIRAALKQLGVVLKHDIFRDRLLVLGMSGVGPDLDDSALTRLSLKIEERFGFRTPWDYFIRVAQDTARRQPFHPAQEYLDQLEWDGQKRLDGWLAEYGGAERSEYIDAVGALMLVAAVRRVREPGCKFDEMVVFESSTQGTEKSSALAILAVNEEWFTDDISLSSDSKVVIERLAGRWIVEVPELNGMSRSQVEHLKALLSRRSDVARLAYQRTASEVPRQSIFVGTTNESHYLADRTGNRRFWPVKIQGFRLAALRRDRDQLWAEADQREREGLSIRLPERLWATAGEEQEARVQEEPITWALREAIGDRVGMIRNIDVAELAGIPRGIRTPAHSVRIGHAMRELGWTRTRARFGGGPEYCYVKGSPEERKRRLLVEIVEGRAVVVGGSPEDDAPY